MCCVVVVPSSGNMFLSLLPTSILVSLGTVILVGFLSLHWISIIAWMAVLNTLNFLTKAVKLGPLFTLAYLGSHNQLDALTNVSLKKIHTTKAILLL